MQMFKDGVIRLKRNTWPTNVRAKLMLSVFVFAAMSALVAGEIMRIYLCRKCDTCVVKSSTPSSAGCSATGSHSWTLLGEAGNEVYLCSKCKHAVYIKNRPNSGNCPTGSSHTWNKLGTRGETPYQCRKCQVKVYMEKAPATANCPASGSHSWNKF